MSDRIETLHPENKITAKLDYEISQCVLNFAKEHSITNADIAGVFEAIKYRMFSNRI